MVLFESCVASSAYRMEIEMHLLQPLAKVMLGMLSVFLIVRFGDLVVRNALGHAPAADAGSLLLLAGNRLLRPALPAGRHRRARRNPARLFLAGVAIMLGGVLLRVNGFPDRLRHRPRRRPRLELFPEHRRNAGHHGHVRARSARLHHHYPPFPVLPRAAH